MRQETKNENAAISLQRPHALGAAHAVPVSGPSHLSLRRVGWTPEQVTGPSRFDRGVTVVAALLLLAALLILCGCTFSYEDFRVWVGPDKQWDWIDVVSVMDNPQGEWIEVFRDESPITQAIPQPMSPGGCRWHLKKAHSTWELRSSTGQARDYTLACIWCGPDA